MSWRVAVEEEPYHREAEAEEACPLEEEAAAEALPFQFLLEVVAEVEAFPSPGGGEAAVAFQA
jgi:hypothetical protein